MKTPIFLRIASIITLLYCAGHTSGMPWTPAVGPGELPILEAMKSHSFEVIGVQRTYWDFYFGFGIIVSLYLLVQAVVLWQLASLAKSEPLRVRPIIASFIAAFIVNTILVWKYFFAIPLVLSIVISVCLVLAFIAAGRSKVSQRNAPGDGP